MKRSAVWPWGRIALASFVIWAACFVTGIVLDLNTWWAFFTGFFVWLASYSMGRQDQTEAFGIRMIQFIKNRHDNNVP